MPAELKVLGPTHTDTDFHLSFFIKWKEVRKLKGSYIHWLLFREEIIWSLKTKFELSLNWFSDASSLQFILNTRFRCNFFPPPMRKCLNYVFFTEPRLYGKSYLLNQPNWNFTLNSKHKESNFINHFLEIMFSCFPYCNKSRKYTHLIKKTYLGTRWSILIIIFSCKIKITEA